MIELGKFNELTMVREKQQGVYLTDGSTEEVLLPGSYVPEGARPGTKINVFVYHDSEDRLVATTTRPRILLHEFAWLRVKDTNSTGAFLDWGLPKDLLVPFDEQENRMEEGEGYVVFMYIDEKSGRLTASSKLNHFFEKENIELTPNEEVKLLVFKETPLGYEVVINQKYKGLMYANEVFQQVEVGDKLIGHIKGVRPDNKIDVRLEAPGFKKAPTNAERILKFLNDNNGFAPLTDKSSPEEIHLLLEMSKKTFKMSIGTLYKERKIKITEKGIELVSPAK